MITEITIEDVGTVRPLTIWQVQRLRRVRGPNSRIAAQAFAAGLSIQQFKKLSTEKQREVWDAYCQLSAPDDAPQVPKAAQPRRKPSLWDFSPEERIELGRRLLTTKAQLPHGHFWLWVCEKSGLKDSIVKVCMKAAIEANGADESLVEA